MTLSVRHTLQSFLRKSPPSGNESFECYAATGFEEGRPELAAPFGLVGSLFAEDRYRYLMVVLNEYPSGPSRSEGQAP